jgi:hypothetical protein
MAPTAGVGTFRASMTGAGAANELTAAAAPALDLGLAARVVVNLDRVEVVPETGDPVEVALNPALPDSDGGRPPRPRPQGPLGREPHPRRRRAAGGPLRPVPPLLAAGDGPDALSVYLDMKDGTKVPLRVPSGQQSGLKLVLDSGLEVGTGRPPP